MPDNQAYLTAIGRLQTITRNGHASVVARMLASASFPRFWSRCGLPIRCSDLQPARAPLARSLAAGYVFP